MVTAANPKRLETKPMVCSTSKALHHFQLPLSINCPDFEGDNNKLTEAKFELFKRNLAQYTSVGHFCRKVKTTVRTHAGFFNTNQKKEVSATDLEVTPEECDTAVRYRTSNYGSLEPKGDALWVTSNVVDHVYKPFFACCKWYEFTAVNFFLSEATFFKYHDSNEMECSSVSVKNCEYHLGSCSLGSLGHVTWPVEVMEACEYLEFKNVTGTLLGKSQFLSKDHKIGLTYHNSTTISIRQKPPCPTDLMIADQGVAFRILKIGMINITSL